MTSGLFFCFFLVLFWHCYHLFCPVFKAHGSSSIHLGKPFKKPSFVQVNTQSSEHFPSALRSADERSPAPSATRGPGGLDVFHEASWAQSHRTRPLRRGAKGSRLQPFGFLPPIFQAEKDKMETSHHQPPHEMRAGPGGLLAHCTQRAASLSGSTSSQPGPSVPGCGRESWGRNGFIQETVNRKCHPDLPPVTHAHLLL